ncbi:MAG: hypothetical protein K5923_02355 [Clostridia bacterium]|nr:hypothetical protein [Clostridia bacterium]
MGLLSFFRFKKLKREDVVECIVKLEKQQQEIEDGIVDKEAHIQELLAMGKKEKSQEIRLMYAKKINYLKEQKTRDAKRGMYLTYNINMMNKLKDAMEDKEFFTTSSKLQLNKLLSDQKGLAQYLNKALKVRVHEENAMTNADETFNEVASMYEDNETIYGAGQTDDQLLAVFEENDAAEELEQMQNIDEKGDSAFLENSFKETEDGTI